ncbi:MAG: amidohydrolase [Deltaproteobacteria bacterium]|nr:amidohydrolase [Deltaproteobacteria bacterium]MBW2591913.1 amidohydrolase [Deltaproteobacteria bacterium]
MIIDFHTHIFPEDIREARERYFDGESAFRLLYDSPGSKLVSAEQTIAAMDEQGVDKAVVFGFPWRKAETFKLQNDYVMEVVEKYPDRLIGMACFDPAAPKAVMETVRCLEGGLAGVGELAFYESGIDEAALDDLAPIMEICRESKVPVLIHTNEPVGHLYPGKTPNTLAQIYNLARRFPENIIVLAHWGGGIFFYNLLKKEVKGTLKNIYFDTAASPFLYHRDIWAFAKQVAGIDKILFGTDFPLLKPVRYFRELELSGLEKEDIDCICGHNAARLLKIT